MGDLGRQTMDDKRMALQRQLEQAEGSQMLALVSAHVTWLMSQETPYHDQSAAEYLTELRSQKLIGQRPLSLQSKAEYVAKRRSQETPEQRAKRLQSAAKYMAKQRSEETAEQRSIRLQSAAQYMERKRSQETPEQRSERLRTTAECAAKRRRQETPEQRLKRLKSVNQYVNQRRSQETPEQRMKRLQTMAKCMARKRAQETPEQRFKRLEAAAKYAAKRRSQESAEERARRLSMEADRTKTLRRLKKMASQDSTVATHSEDVTIKEEINPQTEDRFEVKIEMDDITETAESQFGHSELQIKDELTVSLEQYDSQSSTDVKDIKDEEAESILPTNSESEVKLETNPTELESSTYNDPGYEGSMDSNDAAALSHVEACLSDDINVKTEPEEYDENRKDFPRIIKEESDLTVTETHLISNKLINTTSTITNTHDGMIESQTTKTLIMEIHPVTQHNQTLKMGNPEQILPTTEEMYQMDYEVPFQLNSITGNFLSLEQEAYGLLKTKKKIAKLNKATMCPKCPKVLINPSALKRHLKVHDTIEKRAQGVLKGLQTRIENKKKLLKDLEKTVDKQEVSITRIKNKKRVRKKVKQVVVDIQEVPVEQEVPVKQEIPVKQAIPVKVEKDGYKCTCGNVFQRRSRMETCLRSHTEFEGSSSFACVTCDQKFKSKELLTHHRNRQHRKKYPCKFCPTDYHTQKELFKHLRVHQKVQLTEYKVISEVAKGNQELQCLLCTKTCSKLSDFKSHIMEGHEEPYNCPHCDQIFTKMTEFANHVKKTHPDVGSESVLDVLEAFSKLVKAWKCESCGKQFHKADKLALHQVEEHTPDMKNEQHFQCGDCQRVFVSKSGLNSHMRMHHRTETTEEPEPEEIGVMCLECRKICQDMSALTSHMRLHSMERKYPCKYCDFRFTTPQKRKAHAEIHTGDMKYVCFICEYQCSSENRLKHHKMSIKHLNMKEYLLTGKPLIEEEQTTSRKEKIRDTLRKKEWGVKKKKKEQKEVVEIACDICGEKFTSEDEMEEHKQTHPFIEFPNDDKPSRIFFK